MQVAKWFSMRAATALVIFVLSCTGRGNVDLSKATPLTAEAVPTPSGSGEAALNPLFSYTAGTWLSMKAIGGAIDPVGTSLAQDFDGDGIRNDLETTSNIWVADYPVIESQVAPPVTMKIEILKTTGSGTSTIDSNLTSDNFESRKNEGSEKFHQDEVNLKTINNGQTTNSTVSETKKDLKASAPGGFLSKLLPVPLPLPDLEGSIGNTTTNTNTTVRQLFEDRPFVNNIDRLAMSTKSDSAAKNARDYRREKRQKQDEDFATKSDGGVVRAALYIKNQSTNMPVKLSNILCSLVFETANGSLIPMQSFRLRNDDYSLFEVEVYGNTEFGPYVVELKGLNTVEIENAIAYGYTPKIFIVDYRMTHVQDSNYRAALSSSFSGDNLKIIEENAKGRTALLKVIYPDYREMFRITAFDTKLVAGGTNICNAAHIDTLSPASVSPGLAMHKFLERLRCSGLQVEFGHFVYDFTGTPYAGKYPKMYTYTVKSVNGREVTAPCSALGSGIGYLPETGTYGPVTNVCEIKMANLTEQQLDAFSVWATFNNGKLYAPDDFAKNSGGAIISFDGVAVATCGMPNQPCGIPVAKGIASTVWAGDNYDLVLLRMPDFLNLQNAFGRNPIETGARLALNTKWDIAAMGEYPFDPTTRSVFLGKAGLGDTIELTFNLKDTKLLNPNWGNDVDASNNIAFNDFRYSPSTSTRKYTVEEAVDFELNFGVGGQTSDWYNILRSPQLVVVNKSLDYINQKFTIQLTLPTTLAYAPPDGLVGLYLRPTPNNAYRNVLWPQSFDLVNRFETKLKTAALAGAMTVELEMGYGAFAPGDILRLAGDATAYTISSQAISGSTRTFGISPGLTATLAAGIKAGVSASLPGPTTRLVFDRASDSDSVFTAFNALNPGAGLLIGNTTLDTTGATTTLDCINTPQWFTPSKCLGHNYSYLLANWVGNSAFTNSFTDVSRLSTLSADTQAATVDIIRPSLTRGLYVAAADIQTITPNDTLLSTTNNANHVNVQMAVSNGRAIVVWESGLTNPDIKGRVFDLNTGVPVGPELSISTTNNRSQKLPRVAAENGKAFVVWQSDDLDTGSLGGYLFEDAEIRGQALNLLNGAKEGPELAISVTAVSIDSTFNWRQTTISTRPEVLVSAQKAIIVWTQFNAFYVPGTWNSASFSSVSSQSVTASVLDLQTGQFVYEKFPLVSPDSPLVKFEYASLRLLNTNSAVVAYAKSSYQGSYGQDFAWNHSSLSKVSDRLCATKFDFINQVFLPEICPSIVYTAPAQIAELPVIQVQSDRALVAWRVDNYSGGSYYAGRTIDLTSNVFVGAEQRLATSNAGHQGSLGLVPYNNKVLAVWHTSHSGTNDIRGNFWDLAALTQTSQDFLISTSNANQQQNPRISAQNGKAFIVWESNNDGVTYDIRGRIYDLAKNTFVDNDMLVSTTNGNTQSQPFVLGIGNKMLTAWQSYDNLSNYQVRARIFDLSVLQALPYGPNHFFASPLIERNFEATAKIVR